METKPAISCISLTTDFGLADEYVGVLKGVILRETTSVPIVDLCHAIAPQNIVQAAYLLEAGFGYFPSNTLHVVVVDPGVGTDRRILWVEIDGHFFLAPDNGVLSLVLQGAKEKTIRVITNTNLFLSPVSTTFHGRDIFGPVAGKLAAGLDEEQLGPIADPETVTLLSLPQPEINLEEGIITGHCIGRDHFGNLLTDIHLRHLQKLFSDHNSFNVYVGEQNVGKLRRHYRQTGPGELFPLLGSRNYLEIAVSMGSAASLLPEGKTLPVWVRKHDSAFR